MDDRQSTYRVEGMTCEHCRMSVAEEVGELEGVVAVEVELDAGLVHVTGSDVSDAQVALAVEQAGYRVVGTP